MQTHYVQKNETMDSIAKKYGFSNGGMLFHAPCNHHLKTFRQRPEHLKTGDAIKIPANAVTEAQKKLNSLQKIKADYIGMIEKLLNEWNGDYDKVKRTGEQVDAAKKVIDIFMGLRGIIKEGFEAMKLSGKLLEEANKKLAYSAIKFGYEPLESVAKEKTAEAFTDVKPGDGMALSLGKDALHFLLVDWDTPSYWTSKITGVDINETKRKVINEIERQKAATLSRLDAQISRAQSQLMRVKKVENGHIPVLY